MVLVHMLFYFIFCSFCIFKNYNKKKNTKSFLYESPCMLCICYCVARRTLSVDLRCLAVNFMDISFLSAGAINFISSVSESKIGGKCTSKVCTDKERKQFPVEV